MDIGNMCSNVNLKWTNMFNQISVFEALRYLALDWSDSWNTGGMDEI